MKKPSVFVRILAGFILFVSAGLFLISLLMRVTDVHYNTTPSLPLGFYQKVNASIEKGAYVSFCPTRRPVFDMALARNYISTGDCANGYRPLLKRVFAVAGDTVSINKRGVFINAQHVSNSAQMETDTTGNALPTYCLNQHVLTNTEFLLMSDVNPKSFDARYFGLAQRSEIRKVVRPVFTWDSWDFW